MHALHRGPSSSRASPAPRRIDARPTRPRRATIGALSALVVASVGLLSGCAPPPTASTGWSRAPITSEHADVLEVSSEAADRALVRAPRSNRGSNGRSLLWRDDAPRTRDHGVCVTTSQSGWPNQEGVALRVAASPHGGTRGITVNKNIYGLATWVYNVMLWDSSPGENREFGIRSSAHPISVDMSAAIRRSASPDSPRRLCARLSGALLEWKLWPAETAEPSWHDPAHAARLVLDPSWVYEGSPGLYAGHTPPGGWVRFTSMTVSPAPRSADEAGSLRP